MRETVCLTQVLLQRANTSDNLIVRSILLRKALTLANQLLKK